MKTSCILSLALIALVPVARAASLKQAQFTRVINDVRLMPSQQQPVAAKIGDTVSGQTAVSTGVASRAELQFPDKTLTRIGANSVFKLDKADRTVDLEKGVMLLQVPKQIGGAKVRTAAVTAAVTGTTVMFEYDPNGTIKIIVLEGEVDVFLNDNPSEVRTLKAGDMLIMNVNAKTIPMAVQVDLELLKQTSKLLSLEDFGPLGNQKHLADALKEQDGLKNNGELLKTAFEIVGRGTQVTLTNEARQEIFKNLVLQNRPADNSGNSNTNSNTNSNGNGGNGDGNGGGNGGSQGNAASPDADAAPPAATPGRPVFNPGTSVFAAGSAIVTNPHATAFNSVTGGVVTMQGTIYNPAVDGGFNTYMYGDAQTFPDVDAYMPGKGSWFAFKGDTLYISGDIGVNTNPGPRNVILAAVNDVRFSQNTPYDLATDAAWNLPLSVDALLVSSRQGSIIIDSSFSLQEGASEFGQRQEVSFYAYGPTSDVLISSGLESPDSIFFSNGLFQAYAGRDIALNGGRVTAGEVALTAGRDVKIQNNSFVQARSSLRINADRHIQIQNSSQLLALSTLDPLSVLVKSINGNVELTNNATIDAANVDIVSQNGGINISSSTILADVIKARVMSTGGELLISNSILGRDTPIAGSIIKLYGEGASGVRFIGDSTLNAQSVDIAGTTVTIDGPGVVRLSHPANTRVHTDTASFNTGSYGNFTNKSGTPVPVTTGPYSGRPAY